MEPTIKSGKHLAEHVILTGTRFHDVCLSGAEFDDVNLKDAKFEDVNLSGAHFNNINLTEVEVTDVNTTGMKINGILVDDLFRAYEQQNTIPKKHHPSGASPISPDNSAARAEAAPANGDS